MKSLGHEIDEDRIKPNKENVEAILNLKHSENPKQQKSYFRTIQYLANFLPRLSEGTDKLRNLLKKIQNGNGDWNNKTILKR